MEAHGDYPATQRRHPRAGARAVRRTRPARLHAVPAKPSPDRHQGSLAPAVTPFVRIPPNRGKANQWDAKQVLDAGVYSVIWPHVSTVEDARSAVAACRYPRPKDSPRYEPADVRGDAPAAAARYWRLTQQEYYQRADVWPLAPDSEILLVIMCEEARAHPQLAPSSICQEANVPCGHPHIDTTNAERLLEQGFRWLMATPELSFNALQLAREAAQTIRVG
jgi:4-hydroxy-2-oxoheptanedioate aldolase